MVKSSHDNGWLSILKEIEKTCNQDRWWKKGKTENPRRVRKRSYKAHIRLRRLAQIYWRAVGIQATAAAKL
jgi:hypothetical protein